ncbi:MAG: alpha-amylase family glycosyl hydrolase, partial [Kiritimatiellae bacterium]|nr:alpha-amylase family glycosyl hydrolase [Kiritimatiellia bacterium]
PDPVDGMSVLTLGPFDHPDQVVTSLHAVVRWGNRWDSNEGKNYNLVLETHPDAAETHWVFDPDVLEDGKVRLSILTQPPADELHLYHNSRLVVSKPQPGLSAGLSAADWEYGPHELRVRALREGHLSTKLRKVWKLPEVETSSEPWPLETPYGSSVTEEGTWRVHLYAPSARFVEVEWKWEGEGAQRQLMQVVGEGRWGLELPVVADHSFEYRYIVDGENRFADPWSVDVRWISPQGAYSHLPEHAWSLAGTLPDPPGDWNRPRPETWVVYELSIPDVATPGSYRGLLEKLTYISDLGINVIEPLPVTTFPGEISWGYNPAFHMALERSYGTPEDFSALIKAARSHGIAYVADLVLNHVDASGPLEQMHGEPEQNPFTMPFSQFNWGFPKLDQENEAFKRYVKDTLEHWVNQLGVDGFRYDATQWIKWSGYNNWGASWMSYVVDQADPDVIQIAENLPSEPNMVRGTELDMEWDGHYRWRMRKVFSEAKITEPGKMREILDPRSHAYDSGHQRMPYIESHDEERFVRELIQKGFTTEQAFTRHHAAAAITLTVPGMPMLYAGQEWGEMTPKVVGPNPLNWHLMEQPSRAALLVKFRELIHLRVQHRALHHDRLDLLHLDADTGLVAYLRPGVPESILVAFNVSNHPGVLDLSFVGVPVAELHRNSTPPHLKAIRLEPGEARVFRVGPHGDGE